MNAFGSGLLQQPLSMYQEPVQIYVHIRNRSNFRSTAYQQFQTFSPRNTHSLFVGFNSGGNWLAFKTSKALQQKDI